MEIIEYNTDWKDKWDNFVLGSNNGTLFHMQRFFDYHKKGKFTFNHLIFLDKGNIVGLLPGSRIGNLYESPIGSSYGSIVTKDIKFSYAIEMVSTLIDYGKANGIKEFLLTSAPRVYEKHPNENLDFAMLWQGFKYDLHYISSAIRLFPHGDIILRFQPTVRRNIRKTLKNADLRIELNDHYNEFYPILIDNKARHDVKPTHSLEDLLMLKKLLPENILLFMMYYKNQPIAGSQ